MPSNVWGGGEIRKCTPEPEGWLQMRGKVGKRALCPAPCFLAGSPSHLEKHPLDPEGEDDVARGLGFPLPSAPSGRRAHHAFLTRIPNPRRGAPSNPHSAPVLRRRRSGLKPVDAPSRGWLTYRTLCCWVGAVRSVREKDVGGVCEADATIKSPWWKSFFFVPHDNI